MEGKPVNGIRAHSRMLQRLTRRCRTRAVLLFLIVSNLASYSLAWAQTETADCAKQLDQAEEQYYQGHFDQAILMAENCLTRRDLPEDLEIRAHKIIAKASVSKRHVDRAKEELGKILEIDPKVSLDPDLEPPEVIKLFEEVRREKEKDTVQPPQPQSPAKKTTPGTVKREEGKKGWFARNWYVVAGGAVVIGGGVALLSGGGGNPIDKPPVPLSGPPSFP